MKAAITYKYNSRVPAIITDCKLSRHFSEGQLAGEVHPAFNAYSALWDTGAQTSCISLKVAQDLHLSPFGKATMSHANGNSIVDLYYVNLLLPNKIEISMLPVMASNMTDTDILIGMDVIGFGDFCVTLPNGKTQFSFQIPSTHQTDYEIE